MNFFSPRHLSKTSEDVHVIAKKNNPNANIVVRRKTIRSNKFIFAWPNWKTLEKYKYKKQSAFALSSYENKTHMAL